MLEALIRAGKVLPLATLRFKVLLFCWMQGQSEGGW